MRSTAVLDTLSASCWSRTKSNRAKEHGYVLDSVDKHQGSPKQCMCRAFWPQVLQWSSTISESSDP